MEVWDAAVASPSTSTGRLAKVRACDPRMSLQLQFPLQLTAAAACMGELSGVSGASEADGAGRRNTGCDADACEHREAPVEMEAGLADVPSYYGSCGGS